MRAIVLTRLNTTDLLRGAIADSYTRRAGSGDLPMPGPGASRVGKNSDLVRSLKW